MTDDGEEQVPIVELMRQCWLHGRDSERPAMEGDWARWWADQGSALLAVYYGHAPPGADREPAEAF